MPVPLDYVRVLAGVNSSPGWRHRKSSPLLTSMMRWQCELHSSRAYTYSNSSVQVGILVQYSSTVW